MSWLAAGWLLLCLLEERWLFLPPSVSAPPAWPPFPSAEEGILDQASCLQLLPVIICACRIHVMAGRVPLGTDRAAVAGEMETTFIENLRYTADLLSQVSGEWVLLCVCSF